MNDLPGIRVLNIVAIAVVMIGFIVMVATVAYGMEFSQLIADGTVEIEAGVYSSTDFPATYQLVRRPPLPGMPGADEQEEEVDDPEETEDFEETEELDEVEVDDVVDTPAEVSPEIDLSVEEQLEELRLHVENLERQVKQLTEQLLQLERSRPAGETPTADYPVDELATAPDTKLNPNDAELEELIEVPNITELLARRIIWYREEVGQFQRVEDLRKVPGISIKIYQQIVPHFRLID